MNLDPILAISYFRISYFLFPISYTRAGCTAYLMNAIGWFATVTYPRHPNLSVWLA